LEKVYGGETGLDVLDRSFGKVEELERYVVQFAVRSGMRDMIVALSAMTRKTTDGGELDEEGNVA
jgi:hypothetical protein